MFLVILNALTFMSFIFFRTHTFGDKRLQLQLHSSKLIINRYLSSAKFKPITVCLTMDYSSFKGNHFVRLETLATRSSNSQKLNNTTNTCLMRLIVFYIILIP